MQRLQPIFLYYAIALAGPFLSIQSTAANPFNKSSLQWNIGGNFKSIGSIQELNQQGIFSKNTVPISEQRLRLFGELHTDTFYFELADQVSYFLQSENPFNIALPNLQPQNAWNTEIRRMESSTQVLVQRLDRLFARVTFDRIEITVGKQVVATGIGKIFQAVSQVPRHPLVLADPEYPVTEDAAAFVWSGPFIMEARFLPKVGSQREHNFHIRAKGTKAGNDVAFTAGRTDDKPYIGIEMAGNFSDAVLRAELVGYARGDSSFIQGLSGFDYVFSPKLSAQVEVFYNGFGKERDYVFEPFTHRSTPYRGLWYVGGDLGWEISGRIETHWQVIANILDPSFLNHVYLNYSLSDDWDLMAGQFWAVSFTPNAEFGTALPTGVPGYFMGIPNMTYALLRYYF